MAQEREPERAPELVREPAQELGPALVQGPEREPGQVMSFLKTSFLNSTTNRNCWRNWN